MDSSWLIANINDSFDCDQSKIKLDVYDKYVQKITNENKLLKKRVKKFADLVRSKEEQLIEAFSEACESKRKNEEKNQKLAVEVHNAQLQSYYECFLQIEKENNSLKVKNEQMRMKMQAQEEKIKHLLAKQEEEQSSKSTEQHVESSNVDQTDRATDMEEENSIDFLTRKPDEKETNDEANKLSMKHIDEELTELNRTLKEFIRDKLDGGARDNEEKNATHHGQDDNLNELLNTKTQRITELEIEVETLNKKLESIEASLARWIFKACDYKLELNKYNEKQVNYEQVSSELDETRGKLNESLAKVECLRNELREKSDQLNELLKRVNVETRTNETQTYVREFIAQLIQTESSEFIESCTQTEAQQQPTSFVAQQTAKLNNNNFTKQPSIVSQQPSTELNQLKTRLDNLILEKNSLKVKNDELTQELEAVNKRLLMNGHNSHNGTNGHNGHHNGHNSHNGHNGLNGHKSQNGLNGHNGHNGHTREHSLETKSTQTLNLVKHSNVHIQTEQPAVVRTQSNVTQTEKDFELDRLRLEKQLNEEKMFTQRLKNELDTLGKQSELERQEAEARMSKLIEDFNRNKQISDTIIKQQKKLLDFLQIKLNDDDLPLPSGSNGPAAATTTTANATNSHNLINIFSKKKVNHQKSSSNPLLAHLHKTTNQALLSKQQQLVKETKTNTTQAATATTTTANQPATTTSNNNKVNEIVNELNSNYQTYSELSKQTKSELVNGNGTSSSAMPKTPQASERYQHTTATSIVPLSSSHKQLRQIHVFGTGLNTCPTYCHVCQQIIPLIAYASKCQLCSFTCHSYCSSVNSGKSNTTSSSGRKSALCKSTTNIGQNNPNYNDPLKYCNTNYFLINLEYSAYINKLIGLNGQSQDLVGQNKLLSNGANVLLSDYVYLDINNSKWKKVWLCLKLDEQGKFPDVRLEIYQAKTNLKPFDTISLLNDRICIESSIRNIRKLTNQMSTAAVVVASNTVPSDPGKDENIYEELNEDITSAAETTTAVPNFENSSLILLLYNNHQQSAGNRLMLKLGFSSFNSKNIWYDALLSAILIGKPTASKKQPTSTDQQQLEFKLMNVNKVLKPFLELYDTIVNSYCFINDDLIALACDDGLYALNSYGCKSSGGGNGQDQPGGTGNVSLVKIDSIDTAHKLYYESEFGKLCFIGRRQRQFLSIDVNELNACLINNDFKMTNRRNGADEDNGTVTDDDELYDGDDYDDEAKSIVVSLENIHNIERCHLFECKLNKSNGFWNLAVATPETIFILLFNKITNKYTLVKTIQTQSDSPCICIKFSNYLSINQLVYACGKEFFKMDLTYLQSTPIMVDQQQHNSHHSSGNQPISVCVISSTSYYQQQPHEAILLCYSTYGIFLVYNFNTSQWQPSNANTGKNKSSSSSIASSIASGALQAASTANSSSSSNLLKSNSVLKWPRGNGLTPLQIEYDSSYLYLFYNDSIVVYNVTFENDVSLMVRKCGITFIYKPRYLSTFNNKTSNCIIISNRRLVDEQQLKMEELQYGSETGDSSQESYGYGDDDDEIKKSNDPALNGLNDKICLSYFTPGSN